MVAERKKEKKRISVLLVEDNKLVRKMSILILQNLECEVDAVENGTLALEFADKTNYDIIFMDIGLPDINGLNVIHQIRKKGKMNSKTAIIALTAHSDLKYQYESFQMGATDFFVKPLMIEKEVLQKYVG
ncbi:MAG TPA: response regulator [Gammaproteobacteria bacterium]|jgi:CheY-like chemotaxis protein|nr:response regulator [Gammaproteobacteria bacterium]